MPHRAAAVAQSYSWPPNRAIMEDG